MTTWVQQRKRILSSTLLCTRIQLLRFLVSDSLVHRDYKSVVLFLLYTKKRNHCLCRSPVSSDRLGDKVKIFFKIVPDKLPENYRSTHCNGN